MVHKDKLGAELKKNDRVTIECVVHQTRVDGCLVIDVVPTDPAHVSPRLVIHPTTCLKLPDATPEDS